MCVGISVKPDRHAFILVIYICIQGSSVPDGFYGCFTPSLLLSRLKSLIKVT